MDELNNLKEIVYTINDLKKDVLNNLEYLDILEIEMDLSIKDKIEQELTSLQKRLSDVEMFTLFSGDYDKNNCLLEIHAGA